MILSLTIKKPKFYFYYKFYLIILKTSIRSKWDLEIILFLVEKTPFLDLIFLLEVYIYEDKEKYYMKILEYLVSEETVYYLTFFLFFSYLHKKASFFFFTFFLFKKNCNKTII